MCLFTLSFRYVDQAYNIIRDIWQASVSTGPPENISDVITVDKISQEMKQKDKEISNKLKPTKEDWDIILKGATNVKFKKDEYIIRDGQQSRQLFQVSRGRCRIEKNGIDHIIGFLTSDDGIFGEISFLEGGNSSASVIADEDTQVHIIEAYFLNILFEHYPYLSGRFYYYLASVLANRITDREHDTSQQQPSVRSTYSSSYSSSSPFTSPRPSTIYPKSSNLILKDIKRKKLTGSGSGGDLPEYWGQEEFPAAGNHILAAKDLAGKDNLAGKDKDYRNKELTGKQHQQQQQHHHKDLEATKDFTAGKDINNLAGKDKEYRNKELAANILAGKDSHHNLAGKDLAGKDLAGKDLAGKDLAGKDFLAGISFSATITASTSSTEAMGAKEKKVSVVYPYSPSPEERTSGEFEDSSSAGNIAESGGEEEDLEKPRRNTKEDSPPYTKTPSSTSPKLKKKIRSNSRENYYNNSNSDLMEIKATTGIPTENKDLVMPIEKSAANYSTAAAATSLSATTAASLDLISENTPLKSSTTGHYYYKRSPSGDKLPPLTSGDSTEKKKNFKKSDTSKPHGLSKKASLKRQHKRRSINTLSLSATERGGLIDPKQVQFPNSDQPTTNKVKKTTSLEKRNRSLSQAEKPFEFSRDNHNNNNHNNKQQQQTQQTQQIFEGSPVLGSSGVISTRGASLFAVKRKKSAASMTKGIANRVPSYEMNVSTPTNAHKKS